MSYRIETYQMPKGSVHCPVLKDVLDMDLADGAKVFYLRLHSAANNFFGGKRQYHFNGASQEAIAEKLGMKAPAFRKALRGLEAAGLAIYDRKGLQLLPPDGVTLEQPTAEEEKEEEEKEEEAIDVTAEVVPEPRVPAPVKRMPAEAPVRVDTSLAADLGGLWNRLMENGFGSIEGHIACHGARIPDGRLPAPLMNLVAEYSEEWGVSPQTVVRAAAEVTTGAGYQNKTVSYVLGANPDYRDHCRSLIFQNLCNTAEYKKAEQERKINRWFELGGQYIEAFNDGAEAFNHALPADLLEGLQFENSVFKPRCETLGPLVGPWTYDLEKVMPAVREQALRLGATPEEITQTLERAARKISHSPDLAALKADPIKVEVMRLSSGHERTFRYLNLSNDSPLQILRSRRLDNIELLERMVSAILYLANGNWAEKSTEE